MHARNRAKASWRALAILNAGTHHPVEAEDFAAGDLARLIGINLLGTGNCLDPLLKRMIQAEAGHIAIVASVAGYRGLPTSIYYGSSKAALMNLAESLKFDLDRLGIKLQLISPGFVKTPLTDKNEFSMPFLMEPINFPALYQAKMQKAQEKQDS